MGPLKVKQKAVRRQVALPQTEVYALLTHDALSRDTLPVHRGQLERFQHQLTELDNAIGIFILEEVAEEKFSAVRIMIAG